ncbi:MAG: hypothetical protein E7061_10540 [Treponema sp.]|jgi:predicted transposase/invertase (TIGR01784 family)|nr:hypothetical protein [Treponema sp.]
MVFNEYDYETDIQVKTEEAERRGHTAGLSEGRTEGARNARIEMARKFLSMNILPEQIARGTGLSVDEVLSLKD